MHESGVRGYAEIAQEAAADLDTLADEMRDKGIDSVTPFELNSAATLERAGISSKSALWIVHSLVTFGRTGEES